MSRDELHTSDGGCRPRKRLVALDVGDVRIGLAASDPDGVIALGRGVLRRSSARKDMDAIHELVEAQEAEAVIVGNPLSLNGQAGPSAKKMLAFAERLRERLECPVLMWDERLTTVQASQELKALGLRGERLRARLDEEAARILLQSFLDAERQSGCDR